MFGAGRWAHIILKLLHLGINNYAEVRESQGKFASKSQGKSGNFVGTREWEPCKKQRVKDTRWKLIGRAFSTVLIHSWNHVPARQLLLEMAVIQIFSTCPRGAQFWKILRHCLPRENVISFTMLFQYRLNMSYRFLYIMPYKINRLVGIPQTAVTRDFCKQGASRARPKISITRPFPAGGV